MSLSTPSPPAEAWRLFKHEQELSNGATEGGAFAQVFRRTLPSIPLGTPYLLSPAFKYDLELNAFFHSANMLGSAMSTRVGYAGNLVAFLNFLHSNRGSKDWRDATVNDHEAYFGWRREDLGGARVAASTWDRELAAANRFFA